jgi:RNA polymerase sigma-70 factor (ECF subfamily)
MDMTTVIALQTDQELIAAARRGETLAYGDLVARHRAGVVNVVYRMCGDAFLAEEAAQEAFLRAWQHLSVYRPEHAFRTWVYRIAVNAALDVLRRERRLTGLDELAEENLEDEVVDPERTLEEREQSRRVRGAVLSLADGYRAVLVLREYGGLSYAEIASALRIPIGTVMSRLNSARKQLRHELAGILEVL